MTLWYYGQPLVFEKKIDNWFLSELIRPRMDYLLMVFLSENKIYYSLRYWKGAETPWTTPQLVSNTLYQGQVKSFVSNSSHGKGFLQVAVQLTDHRIDMIWINPDDLAEIKEIEGGNSTEYIWKWVCVNSYRLPTDNCDNTSYVRFTKGHEPTTLCTNCKPTPSGLTVVNQDIFYKGKKIILCGNSARQVLRSHVGLSPPINGVNFLYDYEDRIIESDCNFVREDIIDLDQWENIVHKHTRKFADNDIIIQYTLRDAGVEGYGDYGYAIVWAKEYPNIILEAENEFLDKEKYVSRATEICKDIDNVGLISSCGAWGNGTQGKELSKQFLSNYLPRVVTMHRPYPPITSYQTWIETLKMFGNPIIENEFLMDNAQEIERYANLGFDIGLAGFNNYAGDHLDTMSKICKERNG